MLPQHPFDFVAAFLTIRPAAFVIADDERANLSEIQRVKGIIQEQHLCFRAITLTPKFLFADDRTGRCRAILPVDPVDAHTADELVGLRVHDAKNNFLIFILLQPLRPFDLIGLGYRKIYS